MKRVYWYKMTDNFCKLDDASNVLEIRRESFKRQKGKITDDGSTVLVVKDRADEYYEELGLEYIGFESIDLEEE